MSHRIAYCADGTWDNPDKETNVKKIHDALALIKDEQYPLYDDGLNALTLLKLPYIVVVLALVVWLVFFKS